MACRARSTSRPSSVGGNLACTPGQVVWRNEQLELIQYHPQQARQYQRPLLIVPPQINKYYIFDLSPHNSLVRYALQQGIAVFMVSWRNPHPAHREWGMDDYVAALAQALEVCRDICQQQPVNLMGACAGGLCMALLQGYLQQRRQLRRVASATYLVTLLDSQVDNPAMLFASEADPAGRPSAAPTRRRDGWPRDGPGVRLDAPQ